MSSKKSIILLSGGLDSLVCLGTQKDEYNIDLALTFNYGQKSVDYEIETARKLAQYYNVTHKIIKLPFLKSITQTALVNKKLEIPQDDLYTQESAEAVWVPNRNGLFLNIAASYADSYHYSHILFGANKEEGQTFPDNTKEFVESINKGFEYSTLSTPKVYAPLISMDKNDIVKLAIDKNLPLELTRSCYNAEDKNCGKCESCQHLKEALINNGAEKYIKVLFK